MSDRPKLLWHSNAPWAPTGYGNQTGLFTPRLIEHFDLRVSSFYGLEGAPITWGEVTVLAGMGGTYGNEAIPHHARRFFGDFRDGLVVTLLDVWVLDAIMCSQFDMACWVPVDHDPAPPRVANFFTQSHAIPLAMSRFGEERLEQFDPIYVPHGIDTKTLLPYDQDQARDKLGIPKDEFVVGMVAANKGSPSRKSFSEALQAFALFRREHENAKLYLHTDLEGMYGQGVALYPLIESLGIPPDAIGHPDPYAIHFHPMSPQAMAIVYSAMDVLLNPATGEGFGIPVLEAQSCGTPAIVTDFSAMQEVCGAGWKVHGTPTWTAQAAWQMVPDVADILEALERCYAMPPAAKRATAEQARAHALGYDVEKVLAEHMLPALERVRERLGERKPIDVVARARKKHQHKKVAA